jgi:ribosomal protein S18 acetylase RimI-like enzyme
MAIEIKLTTRPVENGDRNQLAHLLHFGTYVHRHLDWKPPLEWIGRLPFFIAELDGRVVAALSCPPDPPGIAWIRMFVCSTQISYQKVWDRLWPETATYLRAQEEPAFPAAIPLQKWFRELLIETGFEHNHDIIALAWDPEPGKISQLPLPKPFAIRRMTTQDLPAVFEIDSHAFSPLWQNAVDSIELAFQQAVYASVIEEEGAILGYQITTKTPYGAHLGRLAASTQHQNKGIGYALVHNLVSILDSQQIPRISVNTQDHNKISRQLYKKAGFVETNEAYPVFLFKFD